MVTGIQYVSESKLPEVTTGRRNGISGESHKTELNHIIRGRVNYFKLVSMGRPMG